ncbi:DExH-box splicing factor binding site-domain-containing protein [Lactifluus subvellereus]|nr:DExH-box splicing factor binding site-domain-containing protein [Lactifluus subvellereus]
MSTDSTPALGKVSFTVRRPTPESRATSTGPDSNDTGFKLPALPAHLIQDNNSSNNTPGSPLVNNSPKRSTPADSSDEDDDQPTDELVTGFDRFGVQRATPQLEPQGPLIIPALKNRTGADGSVGGLGTRDTINSGPQIEGLQMRKRARVDSAVEPDPPTAVEDPSDLEDTEDQRAIHAILASANGDDDHERPTVDIIPTTDGSSVRRVPTEDDAFKQDVDELPSEATLEDYERMPVSQFGAALLRGMGWKPGEPASRNKKGGIVEPWLPPSRPALLGIGAKEREVLDDGSSRRRTPSRPERKYVPLVRIESDRPSSSHSQTPSRSQSRRASRSPQRREHRDRYEGDGDRRRDRDRVRDVRSDIDPEHEQDQDRDGDRRRDRERSPRSGRHGRDRRDY